MLEAPGIVTSHLIERYLMEYSVADDSRTSGGGVEDGPYFLEDYRIQGRMGNYPAPILACRKCGKSPMTVTEVAPVGGLSSLLWIVECGDCGLVQSWASTDYPNPDGPHPGSRS